MGSIRQETLTIRAEVRPQDRALVEKAIAALSTPYARSALFADESLRIHFARMSFLSEADDSAYASALYMESNFDTESDDPIDAARAHLEMLAERRFDELWTVFRHCVGFEKKTSRAEIAALWCDRVVPHTVRYQGHTLRDVNRIRSERRISDAARRHVSTLRGTANAMQVWRTARDYVLSEGARADGVTEADQMLLRGPPYDWPDPRRVRELLKRSLVSAYVHSAPLEFVKLFAKMPDIVLHERKDPQFDSERWLDQRDPVADAAKAATEDFATQNALTHLVSIKDGGARLPILRAAHDVIGAAAKGHFDWVGELGGIPTIHFAKWMLVDDDKRLLFFSNYDGNWESYIGDFVDQAHSGLNLAWFCTEEYPKTSFALGAGANDEERFKLWTRAGERPTQLFYSAYPDLSVALVNQNSWICRALHAGGEPAPSDVSEWARRLG